MAEAVGLLLLLLTLVFLSAVVHSSAPFRRRPGVWVERRLAKRSARCTHHYAVCRLLHTRTARDAPEKAGHRRGARCRERRPRSRWRSRWLKRRRS